MSRRPVWPALVEVLDEEMWEAPDRLNPDETRDHVGEAGGLSGMVDLYDEESVQ